MENKKPRKYSPKSCDKCYREHYNKKHRFCNICLGRKPCKTITCDKMCDKQYDYCYKCNQNFQGKPFRLKKGVCVLD